MNSAFEQITAYVRDLEHLIVAAVFGILNAMIRPAKDSIWFYVVEFIISVSVATLVGFICDDLGYSVSLSYTLVAISALLARDILTVVTGFGSFVTNHKESLYRKLWGIFTKKLKKEDDGEETIQ